MIKSRGTHSSTHLSGFLISCTIILLLSGLQRSQPLRHRPMHILSREQAAARHDFFPTIPLFIYFFPAFRGPGQESIQSLHVAVIPWRLFRKKCRKFFQDISHIAEEINVVGFLHTSKVMLKILQARLQQYMNYELPDVQAGFRKGRGTLNPEKRTVYRCET